MSVLASLVVNIKGDVSNLLSAIDKGEGALGKLGGAAGKIGSVAAAGAAAGGAALVGIGVAAVGAADDVQGATNRLQAQLGLSKDEARELGGVVKDVFKNNFGGSIAEVGDAVAIVTQQLQSLPTELTGPFQTVTENAFRLRDAFGVEVPQSIDAVKTLMQDFGLTSEQAFDLVTAGFQKGLNRSGDFLETVTEYSTQFANGGTSAEQFFSLLESGLQGGVLGTDKAADAFKEFRVRIQDGSTATSDALKLLGIDSEDLAAKMASGQVTAADAFQLVLDKLRETGDENVRMQAGVGLLGTQFEDLGTKGALGLSLMGEGFADVGGKTQALDVQYESLGAVFETLKRKAIVDWLAPMGDKLLQVANEHGPALAAGFERVSEVIGQVATRAGEFVDQVGPKVEEGIGRAVDFVRERWPEVQRIIVETLGPIVTEVGETIDVIGGHVGRVVGFFREHWDQIEPIVTPVLEALRGTIEGALQVISGVILTVLNVIQGDWSGAWEGIKQAAEGVWTLIRTAVDLGVNLLPAVIEAGMALVKGAWDLAWNGIRDGLGALWEGIKNGVSAGIDAVVDVVRSLPAKARDALGDLSRFLYDAGVQLIRGFIAGIQSMAQSVASAAGDVVRGAVDAARGALGIRSPSQVAHDQIGLPYSEGIARGIEAGLPAVEAAVSSVLSTMGQPPPGWVAPGTPQISAEDEARSLRYALLMSTMATGPDQAEFSLGGPNAGPRPSQNYNPAAFMKGGRPQDEVERDIRRAQMRYVLTNPTPAEGGFPGERTARDLEELIALLKRALGRGFELTIDGQVAGRAMAPHIDRALGGGLTLNGVS